jgi:shikimate kinase/3-dehydroquinate synthase
MAARHPCYAEADIVVDCMDDSPEVTTRRVAEAIAAWTPPQRLTVALAERSYPVLTGPGLIARAGGHLAPVLPSKRVAVVTDRTVAGLHLAALREGLAEAGFATLTEIVVPPGEGAKSFSVLAEVVEGLLSAGVDRRTAVVALGGGVVGDLAGFAAAVTLRGLPFVQVPTTLLAQVDSSVGGKTGINTQHGKNLAGAFHQPRIVLADTGALATLPPRELRAGWAEVAKHGLLHGPLFSWCEAEGPAAVAGDPQRLAVAVAESCRLKAEVVAADEREESPEGGRALLNLGHTFGHAIEAEFGFDGTLLHGEAVAVGLPLAARLSARLGHADPALAPRIEAHLAAVGLPARLADLPRTPSAAALLARMKSDKKAREGRLRFVLLRAPGDAFTAEVAEADAAAVLAEAGAG